MISQSATNSGTGGALDTTAGRGDRVLPQNSGKIEAITELQDELHLEEHNGENLAHSTRKKSRSFQLSFSGLALILLVFQMDATCLSIALPVR
jgi:hypothetical protein